MTPVPRVVLRAGRLSLLIGLSFLLNTVVSWPGSTIGRLAMGAMGLAGALSLATFFLTSIVVTRDVIVIDRLHTVDVLRTEDVRTAQLERHGTGLRIDGERVRLPFPIRSGLLHDAIHQLDGDAVPPHREPLAFGRERGWI